MSFVAEASCALSRIPQIPKNISSLTPCLRGSNRSGFSVSSARTPRCQRALLVLSKAPFAIDENLKNPGRVLGLVQTPTKVLLPKNTQQNSDQAQVLRVHRIRDADDQNV